MTTICSLERIITVAYDAFQCPMKVHWHESYCLLNPPFFPLTIHLVPVKENVAIALRELYYFSEIYIK